MHLRVRCPAKINLFLSVGPKDARNYHPLRTIFQAVDLCDSLVIREGADRHKVECDDPDVPTNNTVTKAIRLLSEILPLRPLHVTIEKRIPSESGLGGGSSDAAGMIRAAQHIAGVAIPEGELNGIAEAIGMDVPFFLTGGRARGDRYGDKISALPDSASEWILICRPRVGCGTPEMYRKLDEKSFLWREFSAHDELYNDFERVAPCECLDLIVALQDYGARDAGLSGSGSAVFGRFASKDDMYIAADKIELLPSVRTWATRTLTRAESLEIDSI